MGKIAYQNKDIASKVTGEALVGRSLAPFGRPDLKIVGILPTNLPAVESNELRLDNLFLLSDGAIAIIDYESEFDRTNFVKYMNYIARVIRRYADQKHLDELKQVKMVVIYTADVESADSIYDLGGVVITVEPAFLIHLDTDEIYRGLSEKVRRRETLSEEELMQLMVLPLTVKGREKKQTVIVRAVGLAKQIPDRDQAVRVLSGILTFSDKVIDESYRERVKEDIQMTKIGQMIFEDGVEMGLEQGMERGMERGMEQGIQALIETCREVGVSREDTQRKVMQKFSLPEDKAENYLKRCWPD